MANEYGEAIMKAKTQHWRDFLEDASADDLWTANRYLKEPAGDGGKARIPTLKMTNADGSVTKITTNKGKTELLAKSFFPAKPANSSVPVNYDYPDPLPAPEPITTDTIHYQIKRLSPYKACGPDGILNIVLQQAGEIIEEYLLHIFQAALTLDTYVDSWREFTTVVL